MFVRLTNDTTYLAGNEGQKFRAILSENAPLQQNTEHMASMRASETSEQTVHRREKDRNHKASMRASETSEQTVHRQGKDRSSKASVRATKKASDVSVQQAVMSFHSDIKNGPDFCLLMLPPSDV